MAESQVTSSGIHHTQNALACVRENLCQGEGAAPGGEAALL